MLTEQQLDTFMEEFWEDRHPEHAADTKEEQPEEPEEYRLPTDGLIIRQMTKEGRVSRRTWFALGVMLLVVPLLLYLSVRVFHGRKYLVCSLIVIVAAMLPFFMMFEGRKPKAREIMVIAVLAAIGVAGRAAFFMVPTGCGDRDFERYFLWRGSRFSGRVSDHDAFQHVHGTGTVDSVADVCIWHDRFFCGNPFSERNSQSTEAGSLYLWIFERVSDLWWNHESGKCVDVIWTGYLGKSSGFLYFRSTGRSGTCHLNSDFSVVLKPSDA